MKLTVDRKILSEAAKSVAKATSVRSTLPVLGHILLTADENGLKLSATDLEVGIQQLIPAEVSEEGSTTVPAKTFVDLIGVSGNGEKVKMQLLKKGRTLKLQFGKMTSKINGLDPADFPLMGSIEGEGVEFDVETLRDSIAKTVFSASKDQARATLTGVIFDFEPDQLVMRAADGFRLSKVTTALPKFTNGSKESPVASIILPAKALNQLQVLLGKRETVILRVPETGPAVFDAGDLSVSITPIMGAYPDFSNIIPKSHKTTATFPTKVGLKASKASKVFAQDAGNLVKVSFNGKSIEMSAQDRETGSNETTIKPDHIEGEEQSIGFNVGMLVDFLSIKNGGEMVIFEIEDKTSPGVFKYQGDPDFLHIVMPMHLRD